MYKYQLICLPLGAKYKDGRSWDPVTEMFEKRLAGWKRKFLPKGGRLALFKSTVFNLPIYYMSLLTMPVKVPKQLEAIRCRFLWGENKDKRRHHLVKWEEKHSTELGGLCLRSLLDLNKLLLFKKKHCLT